MGYQAFEQIKRQYRVSRDPEINALVTQVGRRIAAAAQRPDYRWEFVVLEGKEANAFCLPGGKVGIFTGLLKYTQDEAGMATVISHEVAHALARHAGERLSQSMLAQAGGLGLGVALGGVGVGRPARPSCRATAWAPNWAFSCPTAGPRSPRRTTSASSSWPRRGTTRPRPWSSGGA